LEEPGRASGQVGAVRAHADGLHDCADHARFHQLPGADCGRVFQALAVANRKNAPGFGLNLARLVELLQCSKGRLIAHIILFVAHYFNAQGPAFIRNGSGYHHVNTAVLQDFLDAACEARLWVARGKLSRQVWLYGVKSNQLGPGAQQ
jgi:hypothetical protein